MYKGNYFDDLRHGYGEMYWLDGSYYKGMWERGIQHGKGEMCLFNNSPKRGIFENNVYIGDLSIGSNPNISPTKTGNLKYKLKRRFA